MSKNPPELCKLTEMRLLAPIGDLVSFSADLALRPARDDAFDECRGKGAKGGDKPRSKRVSKHAFLRIAPALSTNVFRN